MPFKSAVNSAHLCVKFILFPPLSEDIVPLTGEETDVRRGTAQLSETGVFQTHGGELVNCLKQGVNK